MKIRILTWLFLATSLYSQEALVNRVGYRNADALAAELRGLAEAAGPERAKLIEFGISVEGRPLLALQIGQLQSTASIDCPESMKPRRGFRPTMLLVSGLESDVLVGSSVLLDLAGEKLKLPDAEFKESFRNCDWLLVPRVDMDGAERFFATKDLHDIPGSAAKIDHDRDGRDLDEDQPLDIDGDGLVLQMRWVDPLGTEIVDDKDPQLMIPATASKRGRYLVRPESLDADGDGDWGEDPAVGVELDHNFPHHFAEHDMKAGLFPMSAPEVRALADLILARPQIDCVVYYGSHDNLAEIPLAEKTLIKHGEVRVNPTAADRSNLESAAAFLAKQGKIFAAAQENQQGSFQDWTYYQLGLPSFAINLFRAELRPEKAEVPVEGKEVETVKPDIVLDSAYVSYETAFVPWHEFEHPSLGPVEIGGFHPFKRSNPDVAIHSILVQRQAAFLQFLAEQRPRLSVSDVQVERVSDGHYKVELSLLNDGPWASTTEQSETTRSTLPFLYALDLARNDIIQGEKQGQIRRLEANVGRERFSWLIKAQASKTIKFYFASAHSCPLMVEIKLP